MPSYVITVQNLTVTLNATSAEQIPAAKAQIPATWKLALVEFGASTSAVGLNATLTNLGNPLGEAPVVDQAMPQSNRFPVFPDDYVTSFTSVGGSTLSLTFRNTTGGSLTANAIVRVTQLQ